MVDILSPFFSGIGTLAKAIYDVWRDIQDRNNYKTEKIDEKHEKELDRLHQEKLQAAQHEHEITLLERKNQASFIQNRPIRPQISVDPYLDRLYQDAVRLGEKGYNVLYEPVEDGYGLALSLNESLFAFILLNSYPVSAPKIFELETMVVSEITFGENAWISDLFLIDVVEALVEA